MTALLACAVFLVLAVTLLAQFGHEYFRSRSQQHLIQARWNARSGLDRYLDSGTLPEPDPKTQLRVWNLGAANRCLVTVSSNQDLVFLGSCGSAQVEICCQGGDPAWTREQLVAR